MVPALFWMGFDVKLDQFLEPVMLMNLIFLGLGHPRFALPRGIMP